MGVQVKELYYADGVGTSTVSNPILQRQFISFKYDDKDIEEFNLIATLASDRMSKNLYSSFESITEDYKEIDGQLYFGDTFKPLSVEFNLSTDGMTDKELNDFIKHFSPGKIAYLILSEHSNRRALARVESAPVMSMLPFQKTVDLKVGDKTYSISTTEYKGDITLTLILDYPFWESINSYYDDSSFTDLTDYDIKEKLKIIYEDGIPAKSMFNTNKKIFLANNYYYNGSTVVLNNGIAISKTDNNYYLYNCGTANVNPIIKFNINIQYTSVNGYDYISVPNNSRSSNIYNKGFSYLKVGDNYLRYALPPFFASYNLALKIFGNYATGNSFEDLENEIREKITNYYMRSKIIGIIEEIKGDNEALQEGNLSSIASAMKAANPTGFSITIDCFNGIATLGSMKFKDSSNTTIPEEKCGNMITSRYLKIESRNLPENGKITENQCLKIETSEDITNFTIDYNYMYL